MAREQFVEEHPQRIDVAARIKIDTTLTDSSGLKYSSVRTIRISVVCRGFSVRFRPMASATLKSMIFGKGWLSCTWMTTLLGVQTAVNHPFLMSMLDRAADGDK